VSPVAVFRTLGFEEKDVAVDDPPEVPFDLTSFKNALCTVVAAASCTHAEFE
jgi:hypothetical protein